MCFPNPIQYDIVLPQASLTVSSLAPHTKLARCTREKALCCFQNFNCVDAEKLSWINGMPTGPASDWIIINLPSLLRVQ